MHAPVDRDRLLRETFLARVEHHRSLRSTNDRAKQCAAGRCGPLPLLIVADSQTAGRGRGRNRWWTGEGSLAFSLLVDVRPWAMDRNREPMIALAAGIATVEAVKPLLPLHTVGIHWPNDVFVAGRKLAGILIEAPSPGIRVIGIGINTNTSLSEAPPDLKRTAVTLLDLTGARHDSTEILIRLLRELAKLLGRLGSEPAEIGARADALCLQRGQSLALNAGQCTVVGVCAGIAADGALLLDTREGRKAVYSGEVVAART
ncbi:MAG: biotin--[acetyl-CoA-carboxylase] ligase [Thermoguttaceae bacterium]